MMIKEPTRLHADVITQTFINSPIPDKFNDHLLGSREIDNAVPFSVREKDEKIKIQEPNIANYLEEKKVARDMVAKWFNRTAKGTFDMKLIARRGSYNASEMDVKIAKSSKRGLAMLSDAGEELIANTFVVVNDFDYVNKEEVANQLKQGISILNKVADKVGDNLIKNENRVDASLTFVGKGYVVRTISYLYQLVWNDSVAAVFYNDYWMDENSFDAKKKRAFDNSDIFTLKFIGAEQALADLQSTSRTKKTEEQLVAVATVRAIDAVIAKLQRKFEVFRTKTPLFSTEPLGAKIGLKEGLEKGDRYEVLEQVQDDEGRTRYRRKGVIKVDKDKIWDNRFMADEEREESGEAPQTIEFTIFSGPGKFYPGMLIRQIN